MAGLVSTDASAYSKAAVSACQTAADDGDDRRAIAECGNVIDEPGVPAGEKAKALVNRCVAYYYQDEDERALEDCNAALSLVPDDVRALSHRGMIHNVLLRFDDAIRDFDRAIELDPKDSFIYVSRGIAHYNKDELDAALKDFDRALQIGGSDGRAYYRRGNALLAKGDTERAMDDYAKSIPLNAEGSGSGRRFAGLAAFYLGRHAEAATQFGNIDKPDPYDAFFHYLSRKHLARDDAAEVFDAVESQFDPWSGQVARYLQGTSSKAELLKVAADPDRETAIWRQCEAEFYIGEIELIAGNTDEARQRFNVAVNICPKGFIEMAGARAGLSRM